MLNVRIMKKNLFLVLFISFFGHAYAQIRFTEGNWQEILNLSKKEKKPIFIDVQTTWCRPCREMEQTTFKDSLVGTYFNSNFICYKLDAEKGEGIELAKKYEVEYYPTYLFVDGNGTFFFRTGGYQEAEIFVKNASQSIEAYSKLKVLKTKDSLYDLGKKDIDFLYQYLLDRNQLGLKNDNVLDDYLTQLPEKQKLSEHSIRLILNTNFSNSSKTFDFLLKNQALGRSFFPSDSNWVVSSSLYGASDMLYREALSNPDSSFLIKYLAISKQIETPYKTDSLRVNDELGLYFMYYNRNNYPSSLLVCAKKLGRKYMAASPQQIYKIGEQEAEEFAAPYLKGEKDSTQIKPSFSTAKEEKRMFPINQWTYRLNQYAWTIYEKSDNKADLEEALRWSERSIELWKFPMFIGTCAHLLHKLGRKKEAIERQKEAVLLEKKRGGNTTYLEEELKKLDK
jgi:thiol-disulfide isomerase/thioredoxin